MTLFDFTERLLYFPFIILITSHIYTRWPGFISKKVQNIKITKENIAFIEEYIYCQQKLTIDAFALLNLCFDRASNIRIVAPKLLYLNEKYIQNICRHLTIHFYEIFTL